MLAGVLVLALAVAAVFVFLEPFGGDDERSVPAGAVAVVDDEEITREDFDHWLVSAARNQQPPSGVVVVPDPPAFERCIAAKQEEPGKRDAARGELQDECRQEFESLRDQVMQFLISAVWIELEAVERDISVSEQDVRRQFEDQKDQSFQKERDYREFLRTSGQTERDLLYRVRVDILSQRIRDEIIRESDKPDQQALDEFVEKFRERYRDLTVCAEGFATPDCSNGPPPRDGTGTSTGPAPTIPGE